MVTLYCEETPELKLGPGTPSSWPDEPAQMGVNGSLIPGRTGNIGGERLIVFARKFATFDEKDPKFGGWQDWIRAPGTPHIEIVPDDSGMGLSGEAGNVCPECERPFKTRGALLFHSKSHREAVPS